MSNGGKKIIDDVSRLAWMSNGSLTYHDAFYLTPIEREILSKVYSEMMVNNKNVNFLGL